MLLVGRFELGFNRFILFADEITKLFTNLFRHPSTAVFPSAPVVVKPLHIGVVFSGGKAQYDMWHLR
jgi:hypothetical protein